MEYIDPRLFDGPSSTNSEVNSQPTFDNNAGTETQDSFEYPPLDDGFVFQGYVGDYYPPFANFPTPYPSQYPSPYPEAPLIQQSSFDYHFYDPHALVAEQAAPEFTMPQAPEWPLAYPNYAAPAFPANNYPTEPEQAQPRPSKPTPPEVNKHFTRLQARKHSKAPAKGSKNLGKKKQPVRKVQSSPPAVETLDKPLSKLALELPTIPVYDIASYVRRSSSERMRYTAKESRVCRPNNAFILYRKAYSKHLITLTRSNDHGWVSRLAGASWRMEDQETKDKFNAFAEEEKRQHRACFPGYKFHPGNRKPRQPKTAPTDSSDQVLDEIIWAGVQQASPFFGH